MTKLTDKEILEKVHNNPKLMDIIADYDTLTKEGRIIILPVAFGTQLYEVDQTFPKPNSKQGYYSRVRSFVFKESYISRIDKIGTEFFATYSEAEKRKAILDKEEQKKLQIEIKEKIKIGDLAYSKTYGNGIVTDLTIEHNRINSVEILFPQVQERQHYKFEDLVKGEIEITPGKNTDSNIN